MTPLAVTAMACVSAIGTSLAETTEALRVRRSGLRPNDFPGMEPVGHIGRIAAIDAVRLPKALASFTCRNNRLAFAAATSDGFDEAVHAARERYGAARIAVILGTSTSGIEELEQAYRGRGADRLLPADFPFRDTHDIYSPTRLVKALFGLDGPALVICTACSSSANAFGMASDWIDAGLIDAAIVGGVDSLCLTTLRGFQSLDLLSPTPCKPCDADRKGISIGEAGALVLLERHAPGAGGIGLLGWGASSDAHHMSTPHPEGLGAQLAITRALETAGLSADAIDYVNLHGTGTQFNDAVEDMAVHAVFGDAVPCSSTKGWTGHALGGAGALEAIISMIALRDGFMPGCILDNVDPGLRARVLTGNVDRPIRRVVSNSFGFGGNNCSLVFGRLQ